PGYTRQKGWCVSLLEELSEIIGLQVYTQNGVFLGNVNNLVVDVDNGAVDGIFIGETNPLLVEGSRAVSVPYRWVQSVGDIVVLRYFPKRVSLRKGSTPPLMPAAAKPCGPWAARTSPRTWSTTNPTSCTSARGRTPRSESSASRK